MDEDFLDTLNGPQREAVLDSEHTLLVLAGAGSGKTRVITTKIVHAIRNLGIRPWQILAVTFTNKAAKEMRSRVEKMLGDGIDSSGLEIKTFHSYGAGLLRRHATRLGYSTSFSIYDDSDSVQLLKKLFPSMQLADLKQYARKISLVKDMGLGPDDNARILDDISRTLDSFRFYYRSYERKLKENQCMDFADLILKANLLLEDCPDVKEAVQRRYRLILVDEYQDSNGSQFHLLRQLVGPQCQLVVVGDDDQSIYRFRGADISNILNFASQYPDVRTIKLEENYRSTKSILAAAGELIAHNTGRHKKTVFTNNEEGRKPEILNCLDESDEASRIAMIIEKTLGESDTAILFRTNAQSRAFETTLSSMKIKYQLVGALRFYEREEIKDLLSLFSLILNPYDQVAFARIVNKPSRGIGEASVRKMLDGGSDAVASMKRLNDQGSFSGRTASGVRTFISLYDRALEMLESGMELGDFAHSCAKEFGFIEHYAHGDDPVSAKSKVENINSLVTAMSEYPSGAAGLASFLESVTLDTSTLPGDGETDRISTDRNVVKLITMHNTKGLEFDTVFVTGLESAIIPGEREDMSDEDIEEERRILYVALTRARKTLYLSWAMRRMLWGNYQEQTPSPFFRDMDENHFSTRLVRSRSVRSSQSSYTSRYVYTPRYSSKWEREEEEDRLVFHEPEVRKVERKENNTVFSLGDRVVSPEYGIGSIVAVDERNGKTIVRVNYDNGRKTIYNTKYCNLKKL